MEERYSNVELVGRSSRDALDIERQLADLRTLEDGWAEGTQAADKWGEGYGKAPSVKGLDWLGYWLRKGYSDDLPPPHIYPTPEGGVSLEWSIGRDEGSLEIDLVSHSGEWHCLNIETGRSTEEVFDLDDEGDWERLALEIRQLGLKSE